MRLISDRVPVGTGLHYAGWPHVMRELKKFDTQSGVLLDDFADATFSYKMASEPYLKPWVGIFHHPATINSPLDCDRELELLNFSPQGRKLWAESSPNLVGGVTLCYTAAEKLRRHLSVPVVRMLHPAELGTAHRWRWTEKSLVQLGYCMRNTRLIYSIQAPGWLRASIHSGSEFYTKRDRMLEKQVTGPVYEPEKVLRLSRQTNEDYNDILGTCVIVTELYGAGANNVTVECMVRGTPLIVNRLPEVEEYLGEEYPLFYSDRSEIDGLLDREKLERASQYLLERATILPTFAQFAEQVAVLVNSREKI
jgi:hypothetical protein